MAGEEHGRTAGGLVAEHPGERVHGDRVEAGERLVEDEQLGLVHERRRELGALLVAVRELLELRPGATLQAEPPEPVCRRHARVAASMPCRRPKYSSCSPTGIRG